jgi:hypothetical protein
MTEPVSPLTNETMDAHIAELTDADSAPQPVAGAVSESTEPRGGAESSDLPPWPRGAFAGGGA